MYNMLDFASRKAGVWTFNYSLSTAAAVTLEVEAGGAVSEGMMRFFIGPTYITLLHKRQSNIPLTCLGTVGSVPWKPWCGIGTYLKTR